MAVSITPDEATGFADITRPNFAMNETVSATCQVHMKVPVELHLHWLHYIPEVIEPDRLHSPFRS